MGAIPMRLAREVQVQLSAAEDNPEHNHKSRLGSREVFRPVFFSTAACRYNESMRIIAGYSRGRRLAAPKGLGTRPTPDRVRESLFSILGDRVCGATILDLYAGTGSLGLEALSRGATEITFVERDRQVAQVLRANIEAVLASHPQRASVRVEVLSMPVLRAMRQLARPNRTFDLVFADPPYDLNLLPATLESLVEAGLVAPGSCVVGEHHSKSAPLVLIPGLHLQQTRTYGDVALSFYEVLSKESA